MSELKSNGIWRIKKLSDSLPTADNFEFVHEIVPNVGPDQFLVQVTYASVDPYLSAYTNPTHPWKQSVHSVMGGDSVGVVVKSEHKDFSVGDTVMGRFGWQTVALSDGNRVKKITHKLKPSYSLGVLGMPGATAYLGLFEICQPKAGETVFVTGAGGAVGSIVGQLAKLSGCRVVGSVGGQEKVKLTKKFGYDEVIDYTGKDRKALTSEIHSIAPEGIDCFFENTGGPVSEAVFNNLNTNARVSVCGQISTYGKQEEVVGPSVLIPALWKQLTIKGFVGDSWTEEQKRKAIKNLQTLVEAEKLQVVENTTKGLENTVKAFLNLFVAGQTLGKAIVEL